MPFKYELNTLILGQIHDKKSSTLNTGTLIGSGSSDPSSELLDEKALLRHDISMSANNDTGYSRNGTIADGLSKLVLVLSSNNTLQFSIADTNSSNLTKGTLSSSNQLLNSNNLSSATIVHPQMIIDNGENRSVAIVVYSPPDFIELPENTSYTTINVVVNDTRYRPTSIDLYRVPVVLVHGLWGNPQETWINNQFSETLERDGFDVFFADYSTHNAKTFDPDSIPEIGNYGINSIRKEIAKILDKYSNESISATQVDVVAHSMGGLMARGLVQQPDYKGPENLMKGSIHRLITIGTPHFGGDLARILFEHRDQEYCVSDTRLLPVGKDGNCIEKEKTPIDLKSIFDYLNRSIVQGGVESLIPGSNAYANLCETNIKSHAIAGIWMPDAKNSKRVQENLYQDITINKNFNLDTDGFRDQNDLVVGLSSQLGGLVYNHTQPLVDDIISFNSTVYPNTVHTTSYINDNHLNISSELNSVQIQQEVIKLLGSSDGSKKFADSIGIGSQCDIS
jgi:pimeloyl-ACP methyl ester carboxylesterase